MTARDLAIQAFLAAKPSDAGCLAFMLTTWLGIARPVVTLPGKQFHIQCMSPRDAKKVAANLGGNADGRLVTGYRVDLTS